MSEAAASAAVLPGTEHHPHARLVLGAALGPAGEPSHAYLFHGPAGTGKRTAARALAAELLSEGAADPAGARRRVLSGSHPDLTWVRPTGAHVMRVGDVDEPVVAAAGHTPFEASRRVFVLERVETMNDEVANRLLKTLEEPPPFVHLILLCESLGRVLDTVVSRCQLVRFDPLAPERLSSALEAEGVSGPRAAACGRLALGNGERARYLASEEGEELRTDVERWMFRLVEAHGPGSPLEGGAVGGPRDSADSADSAEPDDPPAAAIEPWRALLDRAAERGRAAEEAVREEGKARVEAEPPGRERRALERDFDEAARRDARRARTEVLDLGLTLATLLFRDLACLVAGAESALLAVDRRERLAHAAAGGEEAALRRAAELCEEVRASLEINVTEDLALAALGFRLRRVLGDAAQAARV
jgi:DNA polymerase-3 subunit delta'